jgi:RNA recognition motif-containing protein
MGKKLFVGNLPFATTSEELRALFEQYGDVRDASIVMNRDTGTSRGYGFVLMQTSSSAALAASELNGFELAGRKIRVDNAKTREEKASEGKASARRYEGYDRDTHGGRL